jgi:hypothetical protein
MAKKMKANEIINIAKKEYAFREVIVTTPDNQEFSVQIQEKLNNTKIMSLIADLVEAKEYCTKNKYKFNEVLYLYVLLIKYFTNIQFTTYKTIQKQISHNLELIECIIDLGVFEQITKYFDLDSMKKIEENLKLYANQMDIISSNSIRQMLEDEFQAKVGIENEKEL